MTTTRSTSPIARGLADFTAMIAALITVAELRQPVAFYVPKSGPRTATVVVATGAPASAALFDDESAELLMSSMDFWALANGGRTPDEINEEIRIRALRLIERLHLA